MGGGRGVHGGVRGGIVFGLTEGRRRGESREGKGLGGCSRMRQDIGWMVMGERGRERGIVMRLGEGSE